MAKRNALAVALLALAACGGGVPDDSADADAPARPAALAAAEVRTTQDCVMPPRLLDEPGDQRVEEGQTLRLRARASDADAYQWQRWRSGKWRDIGGADAATLKLTDIAQSQDGQRYRVLASGPGGDVAGTPFELAVLARVDAPAIATQPRGALRMAGEQLDLKVEASGSGLAYRWQFKALGAGSWKTLAGEKRATLKLGVLAAADAGWYRAVVSNSGGSRTSDSALVHVHPGNVDTSSDTSQLNSTYPEVGAGGSDSGGTAGGAGGDGADGGLGYGKALNACLSLTRLADGELVGRALTDKKTGLVRIKAAPKTAPVLLTIQGTDRSTYFDEGLSNADPSSDAMVRFGPKVQMHALVTSFRENVGVTPLTEAAYRYAINHYVVDPDDVITGRVKLRKTASLKELRKLTKKQINDANAKILAEIQRVLPDLSAGLGNPDDRLDSLVALPIPVDKNGADATVTNNRYGRAALITGGLVTDAHGYNGTSVRPGLDFAEQIARDLTDGRLDGYALDDTPAAAPDKTHYSPARFPVSLMAGASALAARLADDTLRNSIPTITEAVISRASSTVPCSVRHFFFQESFLRSDAKVRRFRTEYENDLSCGQPVRKTELPALAEPIRQVASNSSATFFIRGAGTVLASGKNTFGLFADADLSIVVDDEQPVGVPGLAEVSSIAATKCTALARTWSGKVLSWGTDCEGSLGRGLDGCSGALCTAPRRVNLAVPVLEVYAATSETLAEADTVASPATMFAIDADGAVHAWGSGRYGLRGDGQSGARAAPSRVPTRIAGLPGPVKALAFTRTLAFALLRDGNVWAWGSNEDNEFGDGVAQARLAPARVASLPAFQVREIGTGNSGIFALLEGGNVKRWGKLTPYGSPFVARPQDAPELKPAGAKLRHISGAGYFMMNTGRVLKYHADGKTLFDATEYFFDE